MVDLIMLAGAFVLFLIGIKLSAFFSGSETGFYRVNFLRLSIDAQAGDKTAERVLWFARNPSYFVATTLIGNNLANYFTTIAIGTASLILFTNNSEWVEIISTLMLSPVIFLFGELMPKNLYFRAPMQLLRTGSAYFLFYFRLFFVVSFPLIWMTKLIERLAGSDSQTTEVMLGRKRLVQVLTQGHREGLLSAVQSQLIQGLLHSAGDVITESMTPTNRVFGVDENSSREEILEYAKQYGVTNVVIKKTGSAHDWYAYLRVADLSISKRPINAFMQTMPRLSLTTKKLEALLTLHNSNSAFAVVCEADKVMGVINKRGLMEQLIRPTSQVLGTHLSVIE